LIFEIEKASAVAKWLTEGAKPEQIVVGIAAYGRTFELASPSNHSGPGSPSKGTKGFLFRLKLNQVIKKWDQNENFWFKFRSRITRTHN
jgi:GH18 family chitinase